MDVPTRTNELDDIPVTISGDLDFSSPLIAQEIVFDPYSDAPDDSAALAILSLDTTLRAPEPPVVLLLPLGLACLVIFAAITRSTRLLRSLKKPGRPGRRKVRREFRMMA